jgi:alkanesulfonate monooxygenase SsuD/methylene tetrahydromethanopterin reductase-like flavin-dependent oxidoreductase (luciferase family)
MATWSTTQASSPDLEFGVFDWIDVAEGRDTATVYDERLALARQADAGRFSHYHVAEHHGSPLGLASSPALFLAAVAAVTSRIKIVPMTFIVPLYDPLRLVQEIGMLDQLSHGRLEVGVGKGSSPFEAGMYGFTPANMSDRYDEFLSAILAALTSGTFARPEVDGEGIELFIRPQRVPQFWYPTSNPQSIPGLAEHGFNTIFGFGFASPPLEAIREHRDRFFAAREQADREHNALGARPRFGMLRHVFVADTDAEAMQLAEAAFVDHYRSFTHLWVKAGSDRFSAKLDLNELVATNRFFVGSPEAVTEQVAHAVAVSGVNYVAGAFAWGSLSAQAASQSLTLFNDKVIPNVIERPPRLGTQPLSWGSR